jgi:hypothetical protein
VFTLDVGGSKFPFAEAHLINFDTCGAVRSEKEDSMQYSEIVEQVMQKVHYVPIFAFGMQKHLISRVGVNDRIVVGS